MSPEWVVPRQGLHGEDIEHARSHSAVIQSLEQRHLIEERPACEIDQTRPVGQCVQRSGADQPSCMHGVRRGDEEDVGSTCEALEVPGAADPPHARGSPPVRTAADAAHLHTQSGAAARDLGADTTEPHDPDASICELT
jgi:hypothetical protein